ncbi:MAG: V-type ATP synthase subunit F [Phycisphaerae bacterium]|nr:V-type ATP synthase subunit F [Phycisphaerae bacterium]
MAETEKKAAALGGEDFILPFSALGLDTFQTDSKEQTQAAAKKIINAGYALIVVAENIAADAELVFGEYHNKALPSITIVPFTTESTGMAVAGLGEAIRLATGINILK